MKIPRDKTVVMTFTRQDGGILDLDARTIGGMYPRKDNRTVLLNRNGQKLAVVRGDYDQHYSNWVRYITNPARAIKQNRDRMYDFAINDDVDYSRKDIKAAVEALRDTGIPDVRE